MSFPNAFFQPSTPFYEGGITTIDIPPTSVVLGGIQYLIDLREYRYQGIPGISERTTVQSGEPSDQLFDNQGSWWRYRISFHHGAGQRVLDLDAEESDRFRFASSRGMDPWDKYQMCLLPSTTLVLPVAADEIKMTTTATHVYVSDGGVLKRSADLVTWQTITGLSGTIVALTSDGTNAYVATTSDIWSIGVGSLAAVDFTSAAPTSGYNNLAFCANRLLAGDGNRIVEVGVTSLTNIYTHFQPAFRWTTIFNVGSRIYMGGYAGNRSELFSATTTDAGALVLAAEAASFFVGELLNAALSYGGSVIIATSEGIRFATLGADGTLQYGPLIQDAGNTRAVAAQGRFAWFGWDNFPEGGCGVGRLALDTFADTLQPAYASDIYTDDVNDDIMAVARFNGRTLFAVKSEGVYASSQTDFVQAGWVDVGELYFGTVEDKSVTEIRARADPLEEGEILAMELSDPETNTMLATGTMATENEVVLTVNAQGKIANRVALKIMLGGDGSSSTCLRHWRARAYAVGPSTEEWLVPLIIHSRVVLGAGEGEVVGYDPWTEVERLRAWWRSREVITYQEGEHGYRVRIDNLQVSPAKWMDGGEWFEMTCTVRLLSI